MGVGSGAHKTCQISETVQDRTKVTITITKSYPRLRLAPISVTLDALERRKRPLAKVNKNSGAHQKNFNEDRPISLLEKCRAMHLFAINIKCMQLCIGVPSEKVHLPPIPASIIPDCTCFHCVTYFPAHRQARGWRTGRGARRRRGPLA